MVPACHARVLGRAGPTLGKRGGRGGREVVVRERKATFLSGGRGLPDRRKVREKQERKDE